MFIRKSALLVLWGFMLPIGDALADEGEMGSITFPNSGSAAAQEAFLTGVKALHSFQFDDARFAFQDAQKIDPDFVMAYWGETLNMGRFMSLHRFEQILRAFTLPQYKYEDAGWGGPAREKYKEKKFDPFFATRKFTDAVNDH